MTPSVVLARGVAKRFRDGTEALAPIDLAVREGPMQDSSLTARRIGTADVVLCAAPAYLRQRRAPRRLPLRQLLEEQLLEPFDPLVSARRRRLELSLADVRHKLEGAGSGYGEMLRRADAISSSVKRSVSLPDRFPRAS